MGAQVQHERDRLDEDAIDDAESLAAAESLEPAMGLRRRLGGNGAANMIGIIVSTLLQLLTVPVLAAAWGVQVYGIWLMLTTIPTYFALSDLGFSSAATADMTMATARGEREEAVTTFQSLSLLLFAIASALPILGGAIVLGGRALGLGGAQWSDYGLIVLMLLGYAGAAQISRLYLTGFRSTGFYAQGTILYDCLGGVEAIAVLAVATAGGGIAAAAVTLLVSRILLTLILHMRLRISVPWLRPGVRQARLSELRRLIGPALAALAIPGALALNIQGIILVAGWLLSPVAAAVLGPSRTACRVIVQIVGVINRATMPEFARARAINASNELRQLIRVNTMSVLLLLLPGALAFGLLGPWAIRIWTHGRIEPDPVLIWLLAGSALLHGLWLFGSNLLLAVNAHGDFARLLLPVAVAGIGLAVPAGQLLGLNGVGLAIVASDGLALLLLAAQARRYWPGRTSEAV